MAYGLRYTAQVTDVDGTLYNVMIYEKDYTGESTSVFMGSGAIRLQEDDDEDLLKPLRLTTGTLTLIDDGTMERLMPTSDQQYYVQLHRNIFNIDFCGFLKMEGGQQDWTAPPVEVTYNLTGLIGSVADWRLRKGWAGESGYVNWAQALTAVLLDKIEMLAVTRIYLPAEIYLRDEANKADFLTPLKVRLNAGVYEPGGDEETYDEETGTPTVEDVLTDFCRLWGMTLQERGRAWWFTSPVAEAYYWITPAELREIGAGGGPEVKTGSERITTIEAQDMGTALQYAGDGQQKSGILGGGRYVVKFKPERTEQVMGSDDCLPTDGYAAGSWKRAQRTQRDSAGGDIPKGLQASSYITGWTYTPSGGERWLELHHYDISADGKTATETAAYGQPQGMAPWYYYAGAFLVDADVYNTQYDPETEEAKKTFDYARMIVISNTWMSRALTINDATQGGGIPTLEHVKPRTPLVTLRGRKPVRLDSGAIAVTASVMLQSFTIRSTYSWLYTLLFRLRIGDWVSYQEGIDESNPTGPTKLWFVNVNSPEYDEVRQGRLCYLRMKRPSSGLQSDHGDVYDATHDVTFGTIGDTRFPLVYLGEDIYQPYGDAAGAVIECKDPSGNFITVEGDVELTIYGFSDENTIYETHRDIFASDGGTGSVGMWGKYTYAFLKDLGLTYYENDEVTARDKLKEDDDAEGDAYEYTTGESAHTNGGGTTTVELTVGTGKTCDTAENLLEAPDGSLLAAVYGASDGALRRPEEHIVAAARKVMLRNRTRLRLEVDRTDGLAMPVARLQDGDRTYQVTAREWAPGEKEYYVTLDEL